MALYKYECDISTPCVNFHIHLCSPISPWKWSIRDTYFSHPTENVSYRRLYYPHLGSPHLRDAHFCNNNTKTSFKNTQNRPCFCAFITNNFSAFPSHRGLLLEHIPLLIISFPPNSFLKSPTPPAPTAFSQTSQSQSMPSSYACRSSESFLPSPSAVPTGSLSRNSQ